MIATCRAIVREVLAPEPDETVWQWAERNIDYARAPSYDSEWKGPYQIAYMPYLKEPLEACTDDAIKEVWMWACTRGGKTENLLLTTMRYMIAVRPPYSMLYIGAQEYKVSQVFSRRIVRGMALSDATAARMRSAHVGQCTIDFDGLCDFIAGWATNKQIAKGDSYPVIFADEVSSWPSFKADTLRERQATVAFPKLIGVSSADAESRRTSDEDPIIQEWENTDRREFTMPDPGAPGKRFGYVMGGRDVPHGVKWHQGAKREDGTWDVEVVENTAYYQTPGGARIEEKDRLALLAEGAWEPTAASVPYKRGYRVTRMMTPFPTGRFGNMARAFLEAKRKQDAGQFDEDGRSPMRVFVYERLAEKFALEKLIPELTSVDARKGEYKAGQRMSAVPAYAPLYAGRKALLLLTVDVQKDGEWYVVREWIDGGASGLVACGQTFGEADVRELGVKHKVAGLLIDNSYEERAHAMIESAAHGVLSGAFLCYGRDNLQDNRGLPREYAVYLQKDPFEGTAKQGRYRVNSVTHRPNHLKTQLHALIEGKALHDWRIPSDVPDYYPKQMTSEQCIDGEWVRRQRANHLWDCEVLQLLGAKMFGLWRENPVVEPSGKGAEPPKQADVEPEAPRSADESAAEKCDMCGKAMKFDGQRYWVCRCGNTRDTQAARGWGDE
jgi:hypothetical protein